MTMMHIDFRTAFAPVETVPVGIYQPALDDTDLGQLAPPETHFEVERRACGYVVRKLEHLPLRVALSQGAAWLLAVFAAEQGVSILSAAGSLGGVDLVAGLELFVTGLVALSLLFIATRGHLSHVEVDLHEAVLREAVRHRTGSVGLLCEIRFQDVISLRSVPLATRRIAAADMADDWVLICQYRNGDAEAELEIASGGAELVAALEKLMRDHLRAAPNRSYSSVDPVAQLLLLQRASSTA